ncbi:MAG: tetratricopeptide repeat protein [Alkalibacterium sp.]|uniref:tetratricopeptide repeat protein n=1 Tax=Alkalibacterium TaxID=99906 RepID=UPI0026490638|nr:tetratricopeptide repeat protein [Alkalibacterium sp.]MDN6293816.1 tetratricopeptide repeat protein [Alkalibacterium sp.]MDN6295512.1 tetratricopeptide repeat protein [Alkalibacterium sp.]
MSYSTQMIEAIQSEELDLASELLRQAIDMDNDEDLYALIETLYDLGFLNETKEVVTELITRHPDDDGLTLTLAEIAIEEGDELEAFDRLSQVDPSSPYYVQSLLVSADYYQTLELPEVSREKLLEAKKLMPEEPVIDFALGELLFTSGKYRDAIGYYERLLTDHHLEFAGTSIYGRLGSAYGIIGDLDNAIDYMNEAVEMQESTEHLFQLGYLYFQKEDYTRSTELFNKVKEQDPSYTSVYVYLAQGYLKQNNEEEALKIVEEGRFYDKENPLLYSVGAEASLAKGDTETAESFYFKALDRDPENLTLTLHLSNLLIEQERFQEALKLMEVKLEAGEEDPQLFWNSAKAYNSEEDFDNARDKYERAYDLLKDSPEFLKDYAVFLREDGDKDGFVQLSKHYLTMKPDDLEVAEWVNNEELY